MDYKEQLKHPKWQKKRLEIMQRDGFKCRCCHNLKEDQLNVHHIIYDKEYKFVWEYPNELLITVCSDCHKGEHELNQYNIANDLLKKLIILSNKPLSYFEIDVSVYLLQNNEQYTEKEAIKRVFLEYIRSL